jgi:GntR family transcriptional regulator/MocR family aminotransferase
MTIEWTGLSPELLIPLDRTSGDPLKRQLEGGLREAVRSGRLRAGERLPSTRELARALGISRGLVVDCFDQLQAEGYLISRAGSATRVAQTSQPATPPRGSKEPTASALDVDFRPAVPDLGSFPRTDWSWAMREVCRDAPNSAFGYGDSRGNDVLRSVLASYLNRVRGAAATVGQTIVCTGFSQGLNITLAALARLGVARVGFEDPGYDETGRIAAEFAGVEMIPVPVDDQGIRVNALAVSRVSAVVLTPAHQWPTGVVLSAQRRHELVEWATTCGGWIVEDDYDAEFRYDHDPIGAVQGLAPDRVVSIGTVSKSLAPTLRLGWMLCPTEIVDAIAELKGRNDRGSPGLEQLALARLIESGRFDRHLRRMRKNYAGKRDALISALEEHAPPVRLTGLAAGFHAVAHLQASADEAWVVEAARRRSVGLYGMSSNRADKSLEPPLLVLGFGNLSERSIREGIAAVGDLLQSPS